MNESEPTKPPSLPVCLSVLLGIGFLVKGDNNNEPEEEEAVRQGAIMSIGE